MLEVVFFFDFVLLHRFFVLNPLLISLTLELLLGPERFQFSHLLLHLGFRLLSLLNLFQLLLFLLFIY